MRLCGRVVACCISAVLVIICEVLVFHRHARQEYTTQEYRGRRNGTVYPNIREQRMSRTTSSEKRTPLISQREKGTEEHQHQR